MSARVRDISHVTARADGGDSFVEISFNTVHCQIPFSFHDLLLWSLLLSKHSSREPFASVVQHLRPIIKTVLASVWNDFQGSRVPYAFLVQFVFQLFYQNPINLIHDFLLVRL